MAGWFELTRSTDGQHYFVLKASNGEVILRSERYRSLSSAKKGIASIQKNSGMANRFDRKESVDGRAYFNLRAGNNQVIGTSQMYSSPGARDAGIESVSNNGGTSEVRRVR